MSTKQSELYMMLTRFERFFDPFFIYKIKSAEILPKFNKLSDFSGLVLTRENINLDLTTVEFQYYVFEQDFHLRYTTRSKDNITITTNYHYVLTPALSAALTDYIKIYF